MIYNDFSFGYGSPYGVIYYANSAGLATKNVADANVGGTNLYDMRKGPNGRQHDENAGKMPGFNWVNFVFDTHFHIWGRIGRIAAVLHDLKK